LAGSQGSEWMKIALISDSIYPFNKGGKETRSYELATQLVQKNHEVHFYTMKFWPGKDVIKKNGFYLHGICKNHPLYVGKRRSIKQGILFGLASFSLLKENFDIIDADHMVYFHLFPTKLVCLIKRKNMVITWHEVWGKKYWKEYMGRKGIFGYWMEKMSSKLPNKIVSISKHTTSNLKNKLNVKSKNIVTIPNAVDIKLIQSVKPSKEISDVIFAGRLIQHKNVDVLVRSINLIKKSNPKIKCIIVGNGPEIENLKWLTKQLKLNKNIVFKGFIDKHEDVLSLIKSSKVFVLPSIREGFGISIIEANACGIPVVTTNHKDNASKDLIQKRKNGFVCRLDEKEFAKAILKAIRQSKNMKPYCLSSTKRYSLTNIINNFEEVYGE
jgi:L-malate glycosyltransferase